MSAALVARRTLGAAVTIVGRGLFTGAPVTMRLIPADSGGIVFVRRHLIANERSGSGTASQSTQSETVVPALIENVVRAPGLRHTVLHRSAAAAPFGFPPGTSSADASIATVEHVMSALAAAGVSDVRITLDAGEPPMMDGSALPLALEIARVGTVACAGSTPHVPLVVRERVAIEEGATKIEAIPLGAGIPAALRCEYHLDFGPGAPIPPQHAAWTLAHAAPDLASYTREIAPARTFSTRREAEVLRAAGMFVHVRPGEVLVIDAAGPIETRLRFPDEPARHKVLDMLGDLALAGRPIVALIRAERTGHAMNHRMAHLLLERFG
ncbi:UDP-3-O-acyl-N-acetylglucosamine deacetylase [soil metagenome]